MRLRRPDALLPSALLVLGSSLALAVPGLAQQEGGAPPASWLEGDRLTGDWGGLRATLEDEGVSLSATLIADLPRTQKGGRRPHQTALRSWFDLHLEVDLDALAGWSGATFGADFWNTSGDYGSGDVGALQEVSGYESDPGGRIAEI